MLNRRILRIKAFKVLYSYAENPAMTLAEVESALETSCEATRSLYLLMLDIIPAITREAAARIENARGKFNPTEEEKNPNMKFVENSIAPLLDADPDLNKILSRRKLSWEPFDAFIRETYDSILTKDYFKRYMADPVRSIAKDTALFIKIFEEEFVDSESLADILEDLSIWWVDDLAYALTVCCDTLKSLSKGKRWELPPLYRSEMLTPKPAESDKTFVTRLLRTAIVMGLAEAKAFPALPAQVTINEYVEISKYYSTPKSRSFVNGLLDRLMKKLIEEGEIVKTPSV